MTIKLLCGVALALAICSPALAQSMTLSKGQMLRIAPDGQVTMAPVPTDTKAVRAMHRAAKGMSHGAIVWMADNGRIYMTETGSRAASGVQ